MCEGNVLVIDDDPGRAQALADSVQKAGFDAQIVTDAVNGNFSLNSDSQLDVVLCEMDLKGFSWTEASQVLKKMDVQVPAIMLSDAFESQQMMTALRLGASDFFVRPLDSSALLESISRCVRQRRLRRELKDSRIKLENTIKVLEQDQQAGRQAQLAMLPDSPMCFNKYSFEHIVVPSLYLSGDFTDYFTVGDRYIAFFLADVSGHGSSSAFATVLMKNLFARKRSDFFRRNDETIRSPGKMLKRANKELLDLGVDKFATMVVGVIDTIKNSLSYSVAGHLPLPVLIPSGENARFLSGEGPPVGLMSDPEFKEQQISLPDAFMLSIFSDGILEILPASDLLSKEALFLEKFGKSPLPSDDIIKSLGILDAEPAPDDIAGLFISKDH